uniref:Uncharacterized protein n=1 Tax=Rhizophora mucronata TaxID=61149 RepID=A0A2P2P097_RHIMU
MCLLFACTSLPLFLGSL